MTLKIKVPSYGDIAKLFLFAIIWYVEFCVRYFQKSGMLLLLGIGLIIFVFLDYFSSRISYPRITTATKLMIIYLAYTLLFGAVVSLDLPAHLDQGMSIVEYAIIGFSIIYYSRTRGSVNYLIWNYAILDTLMCLVFIHKPIYYHNNPVYGRLTFAAGMNPNNFGMSMVMGTWALLYLSSIKKMPLIVTIPICVANLYSIFLSGSRKGIIGMAIVLALWIVFVYIPNTEGHKWHKKLAKIVFCIVVINAAAMFIAPYYTNSSLSSRMLDLHSETTGGARNEMYVKGMEYFLRSPIFGWGLQGFKHFYGAYSHATLVEVPVTGGIIGTTIYVFFWLSIILMTFRQVMNTRSATPQTERYVNSRMSLILIAVMLFYSVALIHIYEFSSYIDLAIIISACHVVSDREKGIQ